MTTPEPPDYYQIPRAETGINIRPSGTQEGYGEPPFGDLFTEQIPKIMAEIRQFFTDWPAHIKAGLDTGIDWLQTVVGLDLEWLRTLLHKVVDTTAAVFDVSSWVAFLDTAITSAADLVSDAFATVWDWIASLLHGAVRFVEHSCNLDLTWLHNVIDDLLGWSTAHVALSSQADFIDGINGGGFWNNIVDWMLDGSGSWLNDAIHAITDPIDGFFDDVRRFINKMIEWAHVGYFAANWVWTPSLTTPAAELPGGNPVMTPGRNDDDVPAISSGADATIPGAPTGAVAFPVWDLSVTGFPAGNITYAIAAVKDGIEGPAVMVKAFAGTLIPPNTNGRVDVSYTGPAGGADSYRVYRKVDDTYTAALDWRLVATPTHDYPWLLSQPLSDKTIRSSGVSAHPKTDAELAAQIVTEVQTTASSAASTASAAQSTANAASTAASDAQSSAAAAGSAAAAAQSGVSDITNAVTSGATGIDSTDASAPDAADAVAAIRSSVSELRGAVDALQAGTDTAAGGVFITGSNIGWQAGGGTNWVISGTGVPILTANKAYWMSKSGGGKYVHGIYKTPLSADRQSVSISFLTPPDYPPGFDPQTYGGSNLLILRATSNGSRFVFCQIWRNKAQFGYWNGSSHILVGTAFSVPVGATSGATLRCPDEDQPYYFELVVGGSVVGSHTFTSAQAPYGASYRYPGQGMVSGTGLASDEFSPGQTYSFTAKDIGVGPGLIEGGIGGVLRRTSTAPYSIAAASYTTLPPTFFDTTESLSPGLTVDSYQAGFVVDEPGIYVGNAGFWLSPLTANYFGAGLMTGTPGSLVLQSFTDSYYTQRPRGTMVVVAKAGDHICPIFGNGTSAAVNITGTSDGRATFFALAKAG